MGIVLTIFATTVVVAGLLIGPGHAIDRFGYQGRHRRF